MIVTARHDDSVFPHFFLLLLPISHHLAIFHPLSFICLAADPNLKPMMDESFLLRFLRAKRNDPVRATDAVKNYYRLLSTQRQLFTPPSKLKHVFAENVCEVLGQRTEKDEAIFLFQAGRWEPKNYPFGILIALFHSVNLLSGMIYLWSRGCGASDLLRMR